MSPIFPSLSNSKPVWNLLSESTKLHTGRVLQCLTNKLVSFKHLSYSHPKKAISRVIFWCRAWWTIDALAEMDSDDEGKTKKSKGKKVVRDVSFEISLRLWSTFDNNDAPLSRRDIMDCKSWVELYWLDASLYSIRVMKRMRNPQRKRRRNRGKLNATPTCRNVRLELTSASRRSISKTKWRRMLRWIITTFRGWSVKNGRLWRIRRNW